MQYNNSETLTNDTSDNITISKLINDNWIDNIPDVTRIRIYKIEIYNIDIFLLKKVKKIMFGISDTIKIEVFYKIVYKNGIPCLIVDYLSKNLNNICVNTGKMKMYGITTPNEQIDIIVKPSSSLHYHIVYDTSHDNIV
jgi:hypothetical protein